MKNRWNSREASGYKSALDRRVYTSRLLGADPDLVLHGGGNTSVKIRERNVFGDTETILYVKGSGSDLATINKNDFAPVRMETLLKLARLTNLSDSDMVKYQRAAMTDPAAPNPSVEAILHALIPFDFVDHTHADAVVTITNTKTGGKRIREIYGNSVLVVPYVMPGFILAREVYALTRNIDWNAYQGMILLHHGVITWHNDARESYSRMIRIVDRAERYLKAHSGRLRTSSWTPVQDLHGLAEIRKQVAGLRGTAVLARHNTGSAAVTFSRRKNVRSIATRGPVTPDHIIRTKQKPVVLTGNVPTRIAEYAESYSAYFRRNRGGRVSMLDPAPRWGIWPGQGTISFGTSIKECRVIEDIALHTITCIQRAEALGGWKPLPERDLFAMEYWELEQAKLKVGGAPLPFQGRVALVTGAAGGIGRATVEALAARGAAVVATDVDQTVLKTFRSNAVHAVQLDLTRSGSAATIVGETVRQFGGLDIVVANAGIFPPSENIEDLHSENWQRSIDVNLTAHQRLLTAATPFLKVGIDPAVVLNASKNVPAPGPGAAAYSVAKAGLTQLGRVAALELGKHGIRVNIIHPNAVFDTRIWTRETLKRRARHYGLSVEAYKRNNILKTEITSRDVAELICSMAGKAFSKTTGAQVPIDGGNERVI